MATTDKESIAAGTDNRLSMLEENDFDSWRIRIQGYIRGKPNWKLIWNSIKNGPTPHPTTTDTTGEGEQQTQVIRKKRDDEFTDAENIKELADIQAINILSQGLPRHIFNTLNQIETAQEIGENVELLMQGSGLTEQQQKEILFDKYERFRANGNESIHGYFVRFHKLINDIKITKIQILAHHRNTKFLNNLPSYWSKYVAIVKNSRDISNTLSKMNQSSRNTDPLAYMAQATKTSSHTSSQQYSPSQPHYTPPPQQSPQSTNDAMLVTMNQIVNLLSGFQKQFPPTNNQLRTSTNPMTQATIQVGQITTESVQRRAPGNKGKQIATGSQGKLVTCYNCRGQGHIARECKEKKRKRTHNGVEYTAHYDDSLAITTTIAFEVSHENAYDSDVDEAPHAATAFMANLTGTSTGEGTRNDTDFHSEDYNCTVGYVKAPFLVMESSLNGKNLLRLDMMESSTTSFYHDANILIFNTGHWWNLEKTSQGSFQECDIFNGRWVRDDTKPYYPTESCPYVDGIFNCHHHKRPDAEYVKWRWLPFGCDIPSLNTTNFLERLKGKKMVFVGDSLNRNMWESLVCILQHSLKNKSMAYEISGTSNYNFQKRGYYAIRFEASNHVYPRFELLDAYTRALSTWATWVDNNVNTQTTQVILIIGEVSGIQEVRRKDFYQEGNHVYPRFELLDAYTRALFTWATWVDNNVNTQTTQVILIIDSGDIS
uniref:Protein trichome birefringence-like 2 n=1 Tax=Tanacetum cinerariifolium TaxID=118510 RepID=A0A6L2NQX3_TANCI|nr:protein trichome birefringence-like 2 [Tanacetum cinerariifolium]